MEDELSVEDFYAMNIYSSALPESFVSVAFLKNLCSIHISLCTSVIWSPYSYNKFGVHDIDSP